MRTLVNELGWQLQYPEVQQGAPGFGDRNSQAPLGTQSSNDLSQVSDTDNSQDLSPNSMYQRYLCTKPFTRFQSDRARLVSARRHVIGMLHCFPILP